MKFWGIIMKTKFWGHCIGMGLLFAFMGANVFITPSGTAGQKYLAAGVFLILGTLCFGYGLKLRNLNKQGIKETTNHKKKK